MNDIKLFEHKLGKNGKLAILRVENFVGCRKIKKIK
jgi:hypothetical protein